MTFWELREAPETPWGWFRGLSGGCELRLGLEGRGGEAGQSSLWLYRDREYVCVVGYVSDVYDGTGEPSKVGLAAADALWEQLRDAVLAAERAADDPGRLSPHFLLSEFRCRDGTPLPGDFARTIARTGDYMEAVRTEMNGDLAARSVLLPGREEGIRITSGHRSKAHNALVGGVTGSAHVQGRAADFQPSAGFRYYRHSGWYELCDRVARRPEFSRSIRLGRYPGKGFIHADDCGGEMGSMRWVG